MIFWLRFFFESKILHLYQSETLLLCQLLSSPRYSPISIDPAILLPIDYLWPSNEAGGGTMVNPNEPPPTLASDVNLTSLQAKLAAENVCVATSKLLDLIRTLRLSALLMERKSIDDEEEEDCLRSREVAEKALKESMHLEAELINFRNEEISLKKKE